MSAEPMETDEHPFLPNYQNRGFIKYAIDTMNQVVEPDSENHADDLNALADTQPEYHMKIRIRRPGLATNGRGTDLPMVAMAAREGNRVCFNQPDIAAKLDPSIYRPLFYDSHINDRQIDYEEDILNPSSDKPINVYVSKSSVLNREFESCGYGLFALHDIPEGKCIAGFKMAKMHVYAHDAVHPPYTIRHKRVNTRYIDGKKYEDDVVFDETYSRSYASFANHADKSAANAHIVYVPPAEVVELLKTPDGPALFPDTAGTSPEEGQRRFVKYGQPILRAIKPIPANQEILVDYGDEYWNDPELHAQADTEESMGHRAYAEEQVYTGEIEPNGDLYDITYEKRSTT